MRLPQGAMSFEQSRRVVLTRAAVNRRRWENRRRWVVVLVPSTGCLRWCVFAIAKIALADDTQLLEALQFGVVA